MPTHNPDNERVKRRYFAYLKEAKRRGEPSVDAAAKALNRFEIHTRFRNFKAFHYEQAVAFKRIWPTARCAQTAQRVIKIQDHFWTRLEFISVLGLEQIIRAEVAG